jgi:hypothetical protein
MKNTQIYTPITPVTNAINTYNVKYPNGTINPTERKVITRNLCIDTLFRKDYDNTTSSDFIYTLQNPLTNVISMNVTAIEFPYSWYTFDSANTSNTFKITLHNPQSNSGEAYANKYTHIIEIPKGNYRSDYLEDTINSILRNSGMEGLELLQFEIDETSTRCNFRMRDSLTDNHIERLKNANFSFELDFTVDSDIHRPLYKNAGWMLGFKHRKYTINYSIHPTTLYYKENAVTTNWYIESESSYGNRLHTYIYIEIDDFNKNCYTGTVLANTSNKSHIGHNIIGRISVTSGINTIITNTIGDCVFKKREYFGPVRIDKLHIRLLDKFGEPIQLNENDYSFMLEVEQLYS